MHSHGTWYMVHRIHAYLDYYYYFLSVIEKKIRGLVLS
jgi:hypothetical protein